MDIDQINDRLEQLRGLKARLAELEAESKALDVELEVGAIAEEIDLCERWAAIWYEADREALRRTYESVVR